MEVHEIVHDSTLKVVLQSVDDDLAANVDDLAVCQIRFVLVERLIHPLIHSYPLSKVSRCLFWILTNIVWTRRLDFLDIAHNEIFILALALDKECLYTLGITSVLDPPSSRLRTVRGIKDGYDMTRRAKPFAHVGHCSFSSSLSKTFALLVRCVEEAGIWLRSCCSSIGPDVEAFGVHR